MMMDEDPVARMKVAHRASGLGDYSNRLMTEHERSLAPDVPGHDVARTDPARRDTDQQVIWPRLRTWALFEANVTEIVKASYSH